MCTSCHAALAAPAALAAACPPRSGGRRGALRRLPHATHRLRRARHPPQPPDRYPEAAARATARHPTRAPTRARSATSRAFPVGRRAWAPRWPRSRASPSRARSPPTRWDARRRSAADERARRLGTLLEVDGRAIAIRRSGTSPGGACAGWRLPAPRQELGWPPTTIRRPSAAARRRVVTRLRGELGRAAGAADRRAMALARDVDLEIGE